MTSEIEIMIMRNAIAFERYPEGCDCGNGDMHQRAAESAWINAATLTIEAAGYKSGVAVKHGNNPSLRGIYIEEVSGGDGDDDDEVTLLWSTRVKVGAYATLEPHCITEGHYRATPSAKVVAALAVAIAADDAGMDAAVAAAEADCSTLCPPVAD